MNYTVKAVRRPTTSIPSLDDPKGLRVVRMNSWSPQGGNSVKRSMFLEGVPFGDIHLPPSTAVRVYNLEGVSVERNVVWTGATLYLLGPRDEMFPVPRFLQ